MKRLMLVALLAGSWACAKAERTQTLCTADATAEAQAVFNVLNELYGERSVSATVANVSWNTDEAENVYEWTGRWPAMNVFDFIHAYASKDVNPQGWMNYRDISVVRSWWRAGGLVGAMWHWNVPTNDGTGWTCTPGSGDSETSFDVSKVSDPESKEYKRIIKDLDQVASYLKLMQKANIPVVWRPLHEAAGNTYEYSGGKAWFWWGAKGAEPYKALWRLMYDRFVNHHGLNNLIWVWTSQIGDKSWYPGDDCVDIIGRDNYGVTASKAKAEFNRLTTTFPTKMVVLAECGHSDSKRMATVGDMWQQGAHWGWFMTWYDYDYNSGTSATHRHTDAEWWQAAWDSGVAVDRDEMKLLLDAAAPVKAVEQTNDGRREADESRAFDLMGRPWAKGRRGICIRNGRKYM